MHSLVAAGGAALKRETMTMMTRNGTSCCGPSNSVGGVAGVARDVDRAIGAFFAGTPTLLASGVSRVYPPLDVLETSDAFVIRADVPGVAMGDLDVTVVGGEVTIAGGRERVEHEGAGLRRRERPFGRFTRTVAIDADLDAEAVSATLRDGVLTVTLPKTAAAKPRKIVVNDGGASAS
jgi:HSP20 family protein